MNQINLVNSSFLGFIDQIPVAFIEPENVNTRLWSNITNSYFYNITLNRKDEGELIFIQFYPWVK